MQKSLFRKYLKITSFTILVSFFLLGLVMLAFSTSNWQEEKQRLLERNAESVASIAAESMIKVSDGQYVITREQGDRLQTFMSAFAENIDSDVFITDLAGKVIAAAYGSGLNPELTDLSEELVLSAVNNQYIGQTTMDGMYDAPCYVAGVPIVYTPEEGAKVYVGAVFASCSFRSFSDYRANLMQMFILAAVAAFMVSFCIVWLYSYSLVRPLRDMASAARSFGDGNFTRRVPVTGNNEIGQLAIAFNNMASSLATSESVRRNFIANVSHELKTPMTTIAGFIDGILDGTIPPEKQRHYLQIVSDEVKRLSRLVRTMLDLSRIDSGELHLRLARFDLMQTIFSALLSFEKPIEEKRLEIRGLEDAESLFVDGDPDMIHQVLYNLIENAVKFTNEGGYIQIGVSDREDRTVVRVRNSGPGIPADEVSLIFDRFYKTDKSRSKDKTGMGLGLYIVRTIVRLHGGEITASSVENEYCQFEFWLPKAGLAKADENSAAPRDGNGKDQKN